MLKSPSEAVEDRANQIESWWHQQEEGHRIQACNKEGYTKGSHHILIDLLNPHGLISVLSFVFVEYLESHYSKKQPHDDSDLSDH